MQAAFSGLKNEGKPIGVDGGGKNQRKFPGQKLRSSTDAPVSPAQNAIARERVHDSKYDDNDAGRVAMLAIQRSAALPVEARATNWLVGPYRRQMKVQRRAQSHPQQLI